MPYKTFKGQIAGHLFLIIFLFLICIWKICTVELLYFCGYNIVSVLVVKDIFVDIHLGIWLHYLSITL